LQPFVDTYSNVAFGVRVSGDIQAGRGAVCVVAAAGPALRTGPAFADGVSSPSKADSAGTMTANGMRMSELLLIGESIERGCDGTTRRKRVLIV
jgi:hypothetical protein